VTLARLPCQPIERHTARIEVGIDRASLLVKIRYPHSVSFAAHARYQPVTKTSRIFYATQSAGRSYDEVACRALFASASTALLDNSIS
jgi:hypothetical protein